MASVTPEPLIDLFNRVSLETSVHRTQASIDIQCIAPGVCNDTASRDTR